MEKKESDDATLLHRCADLARYQYQDRFLKYLPVICVKNYDGLARFATLSRE